MRIILHKIWIKYPSSDVFEYSITNVVIKYDPGLSIDPQFQVLNWKEPEKINPVKITIVLDNEFPKSSYIMLAKQIYDETKVIRTFSSLVEVKDFMDKFLVKDLPELIRLTRNLTHLRFSKDFKLTQLTWTMHYPTLIGVFGLDKTGKSSLLNYLSRGEATKTYTPTFGLNRVTLPGILGAKWEPVLLEVGGRPEFRSLWTEYTDLHGMIFIVDSEDINRINEAANEFLQLLKIHNDIPIIILANKQDIPSSLDIDTITQELKTPTTNTSKIPILPVSTESGEGIPFAMYWLLQNIYARFNNKKPQPN